MYILLIVLVVFVVFFFSVNKTAYKTQKELHAKNINKIEKHLLITPKLNAIHFYNLGVCWQERFAFERARNYFKKSFQELMTEERALTLTEKIEIQNRIELNLKFCKDKIDKIDDRTYYTYSENFAGDRYVDIFKEELYL